MRFLCTNCGYIYDESLGEMELSLEPGTCIDSIPEDIHCPVCDASFEEFSPIEDEIIYVDHTAHLSHIERQHIPRVVHQDVQKVEVCVGEEDEMHPSDQQHRISALYLVDDEGHIIEEIFIMPDEDPIAEFDISGLDVFEIRASCNKHGLWSSGLIEGIDPENIQENQ